MSAAEAGSLPPAEKVKSFPSSPGVYLMKDAAGVVLYVGKAKSLKSRAGHYFTRAAAEDPRTRDLVPLIADQAPAPPDDTYQKTPEPGEQESMPDADTKAAERFESPEKPDVDAIEVPARPEGT